MLKIPQTRLQWYVNWELPDVQDGFRKGRGTRDQITNICWIIEKAGNSRKTSTSASLQRRQWYPTPVLLPGKSHGWRSLLGCSPWGRYESDTTEWLHFHFSLSCTGGENGNQLQYSCLENPRDWGAWWAAVYGTEQSQTRLKWLSSSSSSFFDNAKALDCVDNNKQYKIIKQMGIPGHLTCLLRNLYASQEATVRTLYAQEWDCWVIWQFYFQFFKESLHCSP